MWILVVNTRLKALDKIYKLYRLLHRLQCFAPLESNRKTMKSASGERPPDTAHGAPEMKLSNRSSCAWGSRAKRVHTFAPLRIQNWATFRQRFPLVCSFIFLSNAHLLFANIQNYKMHPSWKWKFPELEQLPFFTLKIKISLTLNVPEIS